MENEELYKLKEALMKMDIDLALLSNNENVTYATHFEVPVDMGALSALSLFHPFILFDVKNDENILIVNDFFKNKAEKESENFDVVAYSPIMLFPPYKNIDIEKNFFEKYENLLKNSLYTKNKIKLGIEKHLSSILLQYINERYNNIEFVDISKVIKQVRMIKTAREIKKLKKTAEVVNTAHKELIKLMKKEENNEINIWQTLASSMQRNAGYPIYFSGELVSGNRCGEIAPGGPIDRYIRPGELVRLDISPRVEGYWGDCTNTLIYNSDKQSENIKNYSKVIKEVFMSTVEDLRPGKKACDVFEKASNIFKKFNLSPPHYLGHQLGVTVNEAPWIVPYDKTVISENMVFSIEIGLYDGLEKGEGIRFEKTIVVNRDGNEVITDFEWGL